MDEPWRTVPNWGRGMQEDWREAERRKEEEERYNEKLRNPSIYKAKGNRYRSNIFSQEPDKPSSPPLFPKELQKQARRAEKERLKREKAQKKRELKEEKERKKIVSKALGRSYRK